MGQVAKRIPILVLAMVLAAALLACGADEPLGPSDADRVATPTPATSAASTPTTAATTESITTPDQTSVETDREALVAFYNATDGPNWTNSDNWLSDEPLGEWYGVETFSEESDVPRDWVGRVGEITLQANGLKGKFRPSWPSSPIYSGWTSMATS